MSKNINDMEDIIKLLIDLLHNESISFQELKKTVAEHHYCLLCKQHFNRCKCDNSPSPSNSDVDSESESDNLSVSSSEVDSKYSSSPDSDN